MFFKYLYWDLLQPKWFMSQKTDGQRWYKLSGFGANVHHIIAFTYGIYVLLGMSKCGAVAVHWPHWVWFKAESCFMSVQKEMARSVSMSIGYLVYDLLVLVFLVKD